MKIKLLDNIKEMDGPLSVYEIAEKISVSLAKSTIAAMVNEELKDTTAIVNEDCDIRFITAKDPEAFHILNHSAAHLMAEAIKELYPNARFGVGPAIEEGFYYDFEIPEKRLTEADFKDIEKVMKKLQAKAEVISRSEVTKEEALAKFEADPYKSELIRELPDEETISTYSQGNYTDLCRGPHVPKTNFIKAFKLLSIAGAYWRGDSKNPQLQRIYGVAFFSEDELKNHLNILEERKKRDHRKIGKELGLFMMSDFGPGLPFWLPNGYALRRALEDFWLDLHKRNGYKVIETPIMLSKELWETSGHWDHYKEDMYITMVDENEFAIKPMNCPGAILVYKNDIHSYKDLPLRYAELGHVHRHEASGALNGLFRVRTFTQDDAHTLLTEDQINDEIRRILGIYDYIYNLFGLNYSIELSTRPFDNFIGDIKVWDQAEADLAAACRATGKEFKINPGDGAFYGPKLDFKLRDSMNRIWQCGTIQLDFQLPGRFGCTYIDKEGEKKTPVMIHRACFGSLERFIGIITENFAGVFPLWLAPVQVRVIPVVEGVHGDKAREFVTKLQLAGFRTEIDSSDEKLGYKIRQSQIKKTPYTLVIGDNECETGNVTYRKHGEQAQTTVSLDEFVSMLKAQVAELK